MKQREGYRVPGRIYLRKAMNFYRMKYQAVHFVVASDDVNWCQRKLSSPDVTFTNQSDYRMDFAILSSCNHTIMTVGTYGWWVGWLAGGDVIYYNKPFRKYSYLWRNVNMTDRFPPHWIPMGDTLLDGGQIL